jgi:hypothetical protein
LQSLSRRVCKGEKAVFDIVLFGSSVKEKSRPGDIDLCIIFSQDAGQQDVKRISDAFKGCHVEHLLLSELYKEPLWQTLIHEGYSMVNGKSIHEMLGFGSRMLFTYNLEKLAAVRKSVFSHAMFGRDGKSGALGQAKGKALGRGCITAPTESSEKIREFLETWEVEYSVMKILVA